MSAHNELTPRTQEVPAFTLGKEVTGALEGILDIITNSGVGRAQEERITTLYLRHKDALAKLVEKARRCETQSTQ